MPMYCFECKKCSHREEKLLPMSQVTNLQTCPCGYVMSRDYMRESGSNHSGEPMEQYSEAAGIHPSQIAEARAKFPHHEFTPDGRMVFRGQKHKDRCLRDIGFVEHDRPR